MSIPIILEFFIQNNFEVIMPSLLCEKNNLNIIIEFNILCHFGTILILIEF